MSKGRSQSSSRRARRSRRVTNLVIAGLAVIGLAAGILWVSGLDPDAPLDAAPDITLDYFDRTSQQLSDLRGKPVVLNFWASWCPACVAEMSTFGEVHRRFADQVEFIGINMQEVDLDAAKGLVERTKVDYRLAHDPNGFIFNRFGGAAMPTTVFISAEGSIKTVHAGAMFADDLVATIETELLE